MASSSNSNVVVLVSPSKETNQKDAQLVNQIASKSVAGKVANPANEPAVIHLQSIMKRFSDKLSGTEEAGARGHSYQKVPHQLFVYKKAITSLRKYPLMIQSKADAMRLDGIGDKLATEIMTALFPDSNPTKSKKATKEKSLSVRSINTINIPTQENEVAGASTNTSLQTRGGPHTSEMKQPYYPSEGKLPWAVMLTLHWLGGIATRDVLQNALESKVLDGQLPPTLNGCGEKGKEACTCAIKTLRSRGLIISDNNGADLEPAAGSGQRAKSNKQVASIRLTDTGTAVAETLEQRRIGRSKSISSSNLNLVGKENVSDDRKVSGEKYEDDGVCFPTGEDNFPSDDDSDCVFAGADDQRKTAVNLTYSKCKTCSIDLVVYDAERCWKCTKDVVEIDLCRSDDEKCASSSSDDLQSQPNPSNIGDSMDDINHHSSFNKSGKRKNNFDDDEADVVDLTQSVVKPARPQPSTTIHACSSPSDDPPSMLQPIEHVPAIAVAAKSRSSQPSSNLVSVVRTLSSSSSTMLSLTQQSDPNPNPASTQSLPQPKKVDISGINREDWEVVLLVDSREQMHTSIQTKLMASNVLCELDTLAVSQGAIVLDCVVERKSYPDLCCSIMDQRYQQQKKRLKLSGLRSCRLANEVLLLSTFQESFGKKAASTCREVFGAQLRQVRGCSVPMSLALMNEFGTAANFVEQMKDMDRKQAEKFISTMKKTCGEDDKSRKIGPVVAKRILEMYLDMDY
eukprot:gene26834-35526_t